MKLLRDKSSLPEVNLMIDRGLPVMCDTETMIDPGVTAGALYGKVRLIQLYQPHWEDAVIIDCLYVPLEDALEIIEDCHLVFHNASYDLHTITANIDTPWLPKEVDDTRLLAKLLWYDLEGYSLKACLEKIGLEHELKGSDCGGKSDWSGPLTECQFKYAALDVTLLQKLYDQCKVAKNLYSYAYELDIENLKYAVDYSHRGIKLDRPAMEKRRLEALVELEEIMNRIKINPRSPKEVPAYIDHEKSDGATLDYLIQGHGTEEQAKRAADVKKARSLNKEIGYIDTYVGDRLRGFFNPTNSKSGRWSCTGGDRIGYVNLQQVPTYLKPICLGFSEESDHVLVYCDYNALELRLAVAYTGEPAMTEMYLKDMDLHTETAKYIYEKDDISKWERTMSKAFTFSLIYGASARTVMGTLQRWGGMDVDQKQVSQMRKRWFEKYAGFKEWHDRVKTEIKTKGYIDVSTACQRHSRYYKLSEALNFPIQGTGSECTKHAIRYLYTRYPDARLVNTIHDSIILECHQDDAELWKDRLGSCMSEAFSFVTQNWPSTHIGMPKEAEADKKWTF